MSIFNRLNQTFIDENNQKAIQKVRQSDQYQRNQKQIEIITKILVEHADVPQEILDTLIDSVQENVSLEYKATISHN